MSLAVTLSRVAERYGIPRAIVMLQAMPEGKGLDRASARVIVRNAIASHRATSLKCDGMGYGGDPVIAQYRTRRYRD